MSNKEFLEKIIAQLSLDLKDAREFINVDDDENTYREALMYYKGIEHALEFLCNLFHTI